MRGRLLLLSIGLFAGCATGNRQTDIRREITVIGNVQYYDSSKKTNIPVKYALIQVGRMGTVTNDSGDFTLILYPQRIKPILEISANGLKSKKIKLQIPVEGSDSNVINVGTTVLAVSNRIENTL